MSGRYASQKGQDRWVIESVFKHKRDGYFVDVGAGDGRVYSNTLVLEARYGWTGIAVEPHTSAFRALAETRRCTCDNAVIDGRRGEVRFLEHGLRSGIVSDDTDNNSRLRASVLLEHAADISDRATITLEDLLKKHHAPATIDFLSLDVEGAEERILCDFPFGRYVFLALVIERPTPRLNRRLFDAGYVFVRRSRPNPFDAFYVHQSCPVARTLRKEPFSQVPPKDF